jgi:ferredoxin
MTTSLLHQRLSQLERLGQTGQPVPGGKVLGGNEKVSVFPERCVAVRNKNASCKVCQELCPSDAILLSNNQLAVDAQLCMGCRLCSTACPTAAFEPGSPSDAELLGTVLAMLRETGKMPIFSCHMLLQQHSDAPAAQGLIGLPCLGSLSENVLLPLAQSTSEPLILARADCTGCAFFAGYVLADSVFETIGALLGAWGLSNPLEIATGLPKDCGVVVAEERDRQDAEVDAGAEAEVASMAVDGLTRRDFFTQLFKVNENHFAAATAGMKAGTGGRANGDPADSAASAPDAVLASLKVGTDGIMPQSVPSYRALLISGLNQTGEPVAESLSSRLWGRVSIDVQLCNSCMMCATFCPSSALKKHAVGQGAANTASPALGLAVPEDLGAGPHIEHHPALCTQCRLCEDICPHEALQLSSTVSISELLEQDPVVFRLKPRRGLNAPDQIYRGMFELLGGGQIYER